MFTEHSIHSGGVFCSEPIADGKDVAVVGFVGVLGGGLIPVPLQTGIFKDKPARRGNRNPVRVNMNTALVSDALI